MKITINNNFFEEKEYIINVLFNNFLGLRYTLQIDSSISDTIIELDSGKMLILEDHFFMSETASETYLTIENIPIAISDAIISELNMPFLSLYGPAEIIFNENCIRIKGDILAGSFFMLSRWEEYVNKDRDINNRFPASASLAVKSNFIDRPIVNEYVEIIWSSLLRIGINQNRKKTSFNFLLTHDVDLPRLWWSGKDFVKSIGGALLKRKSLKEALTLLRHYIARNDPFDVFDWMMTLSEKYGFTSHFFFMSGGTSKKDNFYKIDHPEIKKLISEIKLRKHSLGFHPSFNAYNDLEQFTKERELLEGIAGVPIKSGRHHFLRFENPTTWQIWEDNGMHWDSTMSYHDKEGFRCGVCYPFPVFNIHTKEKLSLLERPLIVMEGSFITHQKEIKLDEMVVKIKNLIDTTHRYNGEFVFLWHNSAFRNLEHRRVYEEILIYTAKKYP